jgi:hypothetical protein
MADEFGTGVALALVKDGRILPVLDGLDEAGQDVRPQILSEINASLTAENPLVITCRTAEYRNAVNVPGGDVLTAAAVLEASPLRLADARRYILNCVPPYSAGPWRAVLRRATVRQTPLAEALASPLNLWLIRKVYIERHIDPAALLDTCRFPNADAMIGHLLDHLVGAIVESYNFSNKNTKVYGLICTNRKRNPRSAQRWLSFLATELQDADLTNIRWWQLGGTVADYNVRLMTGLVAALASAGTAVAGIWLVTSLFIGLRAGITPLLSNGLGIGIRLAPLSAILAGCSAFIVTTLAFGRPATSRTIGQAVPTMQNGRRRTRVARRNFASGLVCATACGLVGGLVGATTRGAAGALGYGVTGTLIGGLAGALPLASRTNPVYADLHLHGRIKSLIRDTTSGIASGLAIGLVVGVVAGLMTGLVEYLAEGLSARLGDSIARGLEFGLSFGSLFGITYGVNGWIMTPVKEDASETPALTLRRDTQRATVLVITVGAAFGLSLPLTLGSIFPLNIGLYSSIAIGVCYGSVGGFVYGCSAASTRYYVSVFLLWLRGSVPLRLMAFLADAHSMGLLRQEGPIYQFRNAKLQSHLADYQLKGLDKPAAKLAEVPVVVPP